MKATIRSIALAIAATALAGCEKNLPGAKADAVLVELAPNVVSSAEGSLHVRARVFDASAPLVGWTVRIQISYVDRNGGVRTFAGPTGETDRTGALEHIFEGLYWEGSGTVTAEVLDELGQPYIGRNDVAVRGEATFSVLDRSPPVITIQGVGADNKVGPGLPIDVPVTVSDEIGVSQVFFEAFGEANTFDSTLIASGSTGATVTFSFDVPGGALSGPTITLYAMAEDLSGNRSAAVPVVLTVDPTISIAVPPGFTGTEITNLGTTPTALAVSPMLDGGVNYVYVADDAGAACGNRCLRKIDPTTGAVADTIALVNAEFTGFPLGLAFDATGAFAYVMEGGVGNPDSGLWRLEFQAGMGYTALTPCNVLVGNNFADPFHAIVDGTDVVFVDAGDERIKKFAVADCDGTGDATDVTGAIFAQFGGGNGWGITQIPASDYLSSDEGNDLIYRSVPGTGATTVYETGGGVSPASLNAPIGVDWLAGGATSYADSLFVANSGSQRVVSTRGNFTTRSFATLRNDPLDLGFFGGNLFIVTVNGRVYRVGGF